MANTAPKKFGRAFTIRVDDEFLKHVELLRRLAIDENVGDPIPTASDVVRDAVLNDVIAHQKRAIARKGKQFK